LFKKTQEKKLKNQVAQTSQKSHDPVFSEFSCRHYLLVWRNYSTEHFFAPYPGHPSSQDFINFKNDELIMFEDEMPDMYKTE